MKEVTIFIYLDACRYDYISNENTPFLFQLSQKGFISRIRTVPGFTQEAAMMTGKYPDETGYFTWFRYSPTRSPFSWTRPFGFLVYLRKLRLYYLAKVGIRTITRLITKERYPDPAFIPLNILSYFDNVSTVLPSHLPTIASLCRLSKRTCLELSTIYNFSGSKKCCEVLKPVIVSVRKGSPFDLYLIHIGELDWLGHKYGPHPWLFRDYLREIDSSIRNAYEAIKQKGYDCNIVVSSDHGMNDVVGLINIEKLLEQLPLKVPRDYIYFLDSTMARFWFSSEKARWLIERSLARVRNGHILSKGEKARLHIDLGDKEYGELLFWANKGYMIFPNFFQSITPREVRGMHGYTSDSDGVLIVYPKGQQIRNLMEGDVVPLVDVFSIVLQVAEIPESCGTMECLPKR